MEEKRVVIIQDASKQVALSAIRWALDGFLLKPGDKLTLLGVLHHDNISTTARKLEEFESNTELIRVSKVYEEQKVLFNIEVVADPSPKAVALKSAKDLNATWVILDRKMKKDKRFFMERLSCGISRMKRDGRILPLRVPELINANRIVLKEQCAGVVSYEVMMPGSPEEDDLFSIVISPMGHSSTNPAVSNRDLTQQSSGRQLTERFDVFGNSACTTCNNRRPNIRWRKSFSYAELEAATGRFSSTNDLSEARSGTIFRGRLENKLNVVIKKSRAQEDTNFKFLMDRFSTITHDNLVMFLGCCTEGSQRLMVYEYACNGSLHEYLSNERSTTLTWAERIKIAVGAARGLNHLHQNNISPDPITSRKILLTHDFEPMIGDICMGRLLSDKNSAKSRKFLIMTNVHSFGIILLELITGQMIEQRALLSSARTLIKQRRHLKLADSRISGSLDISQLFRVAQLARKCISKKPDKRLEMDEVVSALGTISKLGNKDEYCPSPNRTLQPARHTQLVEAESSLKRTLSSTSSTSGTEKSFGSPLWSGRRSFQLVREWRSTREAKLYWRYAWLNRKSLFPVHMLD